MREQDMRQIIGEFLTRATRKVVLPASLGLGLALSGCGDRPPVAGDGAAIQDATAEQGAWARYAAPFADGGSYADAVQFQPEYAAPFPEPDLGPANALYAAPYPETDAATTLPQTDAGPPAGKYGAPFPKDMGAAPDDGPINVPMYAAAMPDLQAKKTDAG